MEARGLRVTPALPLRYNWQVPYLMTTHCSHLELRSLILQEPRATLTTMKGSCLGTSQTLEDALGQGPFGILRGLS